MVLAGWASDRLGRGGRAGIILGGLVAGVLEHVPVSDRMMLDTGDGAALCFLGDPEDALFAASNLRAGSVAAGPELALRIGINLGPLRIVKDVNGQPNMLGDGINVAQRVMSFAEPNQILVSRSYYEIVSRLSHEDIEDGRVHILQDRQVPPDVTILRILGPFLFGMTDKLADAIPDMQKLPIEEFLARWSG